MPGRMVTIDGNEAAARVAYHTNEIIAIYPITPASPMGEWADEWAARQLKNLWGVVPMVVEMESEAGAAGALHGALQAGALGTTFTASQGLLLMIPNMFKMAGELTPTVIHVAARDGGGARALDLRRSQRRDGLPKHGLRAARLELGPGSDGPRPRGAGGQPATRASRSCTSSMASARLTRCRRSKQLSVEVMRAMVDDDLVHAHRTRALSPEHPVIRGTAQNPDVFFQAREAANAFYLACPSIVQAEMDRLETLTGRPTGCSTTWAIPMPRASSS